MAKKVFIYIIPIFIFLALQGVSQEVIRKGFFFEKTLDYNSFSEDSHGNRIISSLATNNVKSLAWVKINVRANLLVTLNKADVGQLSANIILQDHVISGETFFRDFSIDTLLMPDVIEGNLKFFIGDQIITTQPWLIAFNTGLVQMFISDTVEIDVDKLRVELEISHFEYSDSRYIEFIQRTTLINSYYSYHQLLTEMISRINKKGLNKNQNPSYLFVSWEEINRVNNYIDSYQFANRLNLELYDPQKFIILYDKSKRLERRANTLKSWLTKSSVSNIFDDKHAFCHGFAGLSEGYLNQAGEHQPYIASGFSEVARIITGDDVRQMLEEASKIYDVFNKVDNESTIQAIYNHFIEFADTMLVHKEYVETLDLLYNGSLMLDWFSVTEKSPEYDRIYRNAIDGLMSSYLKVASMAFRNESFFMAEKYYEKALEVYEIHSDNLKGERLASDAFLLFIRNQTEMSYKMIEDQEYFKAISLLNKASEIGEEQSLNLNQQQIDSAYGLSYNGLYDKRLDTVQNMLDGNQLEEALLALERTSDFKKEKDNYLQDVNQLHFKFLAGALFDIYYKKGNFLLNSDKPEKALFIFIKAKSINDKYVQKQHKELDSLIYNATVPVVLDLVKQASFEVWANRIDQATILLNEAVDIQRKYQQEENDEINQAIASLQYKIDQRHCVNKANECFAISKSAANRIASKKYEEAWDLLLQGENIIADHPECDIEGKSITDLLNQYKDVFSYYALVRDVNNHLMDHDYYQAIAALNELSEMYNLKNIQRFGIETTDMHGFVKKQNTPTLTYAAADYFTNMSEYDKAFSYLVLLKSHNVNPKETKQLQQSIGNGLAKKSDNTGLSKKEKVLQYTNGNKWYRYFKASYLN